MHDDPRPGYRCAQGRRGGIGGVAVNKQVSGERVDDINVDGVSHYGLYPDWIEDLRQLGISGIIGDMARGPEAYPQMWERSLGVSNDACRQPSLLKRDSTIKAIRKGTKVKVTGGSGATAVSGEESAARWR